MGKIFFEIYPAFNIKRFQKNTSDTGKLELKERVKLLTHGLKCELPENYSEAIPIIQKVLAKKTLSGFELWPVSEYIGQFGTKHFKESFEAMYLLTQQFTSEFAIRPFLLKDHAQVLKILKKYTKDKNVHVRRWVSEGSRPILPWDGKLAAFILNPELTLDLLEALKYDDELYVRKSVANHLNDITKNHPEVVIRLLSRWSKEAPENQKNKIEWITRHALRVLIKKGHPGALGLMGVGKKVEIKFHRLKLNAKKFNLGNTLEFEIVLSSRAKKKQKIIVDYLIHFQKANGKTTPKVFKFKTLELDPGEKLILTKKHKLKKISTMTFYKGLHGISIQINGKIYALASWMFHP